MADTKDKCTVFTNLNVRIGFICAGGVAGSQTVVGGIKSGDPVLSVVAFATAGLGSGVDVTSEIVGGKASADDTIDNTGGTSLSGKSAIVQFLSANPT